jgi:hypothetical protein
LQQVVADQVADQCAEKWVDRHRFDFRFVASLRKMVSMAPSIALASCVAGGA